MASAPLFLVGLSLVLATADATLVSSRPAMDAPGNHERCNCRALRTANFRLASQLRRERRQHATELASLRRAIHEMQPTGIPPRKHKRNDQNTLVAHRSTIGTNHAARSISPTVPTVAHTVAHPGRSGARELLQPDLEQLRSGGCSQAEIEQLVGSPPEDVLEAVNTLLISNVQCGLCIVNCATSVPDFQFNIRNTLSMVRSRRNHGIVAAMLIICLCVCVCAAAHLYMELWTSARAPLRSFRDR